MTSLLLQITAYQASALRHPAEPSARDKRLGWSLRRIEETTGVRRETASRYLVAAGIAGSLGAPAPKIGHRGVRSFK
jgi:hypothetical protein